MLILELTDDECVNLRNLLDVAVRGGGMRAAELAVEIDRKIQRAAQARMQAQSNGLDRTAQ